MNCENLRKRKEKSTSKKTGGGTHAELLISTIIESLWQRERLIETVLFCAGLQKKAEKILSFCRKSADDYLQWLP